MFDLGKVSKETQTTSIPSQTDFGTVSPNLYLGR